MAVDTYYFDGSGGINDPNNVWSNPSNAFDGDTETFASSETPSGDNYLEGLGTTAPSSGELISQVRTRFIAIDVTDAWVVASEPTGGWSWDKVQNLKVRVAPVQLPPIAERGLRVRVLEQGGEELSFRERLTDHQFSMVELEVTTSSSIQGVQSITGISTIQI